MPKINILPDLLVNKIAAGEVIERPASVVKELVENSLDAGAKRIEIAIEQGGRRLIRIVDDGDGMDADDLAKSILPHATSKITREDDLFAIRTMGFRGEALPSIGAVSQLRVISRRADSDSAHEIFMAGHRIEPVKAVGGPTGTTVEVRELFFNVPARQKFLRTAQTEIGHITEQLARVALVHTRVEFRLTHNDRLIHHLRPADNMLSRIADLFGAEAAEALLDFSRHERGLKIQGYAGRPADSRASGKWQYIFLNGRHIHDRFISHAAREAYRGLMEANRYPVFFLALEIDPAMVDINVHPTKSEVRWQDSNMIYSQVLSALRDRFLNTRLTPQYQTSQPGHVAQEQKAGGAATSAPAGPVAGLPRDAAEGQAEDELANEQRQQVRKSIADFFKRQPIPTGRGPGRLSPSSPLPSFPGPLRSSNHSESGSVSSTTPSDHSSSWLPLPWDQPDDTVSKDTHFAQAALSPRPAAAHPSGSHTIQIHNCYLVTETETGLTIIDQHALHERILYEHLSQQITRGALESQRLLLPETIDVTPEHLALIESHGEVFAQLGFELSAFGPNAIAAHATPSMLQPARAAEFLRDMLDFLAERRTPASPEMLMNDLVSMMACKAAVKAGDPLSLEEIDSLMTQRHQVSRSTNCPHGRPTALDLSLTELEKQFKRT